MTNNMKKQILLFILALIPLLASAEEIDGINYSLYDNQATVIRKSPKYEGNIVIPETITYEGREYRVTSIDEFAFEDCTSLTSINIPNSVTSIRYYAFYSCSGLTSITIPNSVTSIGGWAFYMCSSLTSINIPDGISTINVSTFSGCSSLTSINIPNSVTSIGNSAFENCSSLTSINIPDGVPTINVSTFSGCSSLTSITIPNSVTFIDRSAFVKCTSLTSITIQNPIPPYCEKSAFDDFTIPLYVPQGCVLQYKAADIWRNFIIVREISDEGKDIYLSINDGAHGSLKLKIEPATPYMTLKLEADLGWRVYSVSWNGENVTAEVASDGTYTTPVITQNSMLNIVYAQGGTSAPAVESNQLQLSSYGNHLIINGTEGNEHVSVYTLDGKCITTLYATADRTEIQLENSGTYIVKVNNSVFKVNL